MLVRPLVLKCRMSRHRSEACIGAKRASPALEFFSFIRNLGNSFAILHSTEGRAAFGRPVFVKEFTRASRAARNRIDIKQSGRNRYGTRITRQFKPAFCRRNLR